MPKRELFTKYKRKINEHIDEKFHSYKHVFTHTSQSSADALDRLHIFSKGGKGIRGGLLMMTAEIFEYTNENTILDIAAAFEILQGSLLIHDDIMDNDFVRRGSASLFAQYIPDGKKLKTDNPTKYAQSMAICVGDVGFFIAMDMCNKALLNHPQKIEIIERIHKELITVGLAQMDDVALGANRTTPTLDDVLTLYLYKTAHYTFSLPLTTGALLASKSARVVNTLNKIGEEIGLLFQMKDDEIEISSTESQTGKPAGSDLREDKKTVSRILLEKHISRSDEQILKEIVKGKNITKKDIQTYLELLEKYSVDKQIETIVTSHEENARSLIESLKLVDSNKMYLLELLQFIKKRKA